MAVRFYSSTAAETTLSGTINSSATTINVGSTTGFPVSFPYTLALDYEGAAEELVDVTAAAGTSLTVTRAADGTSATSHNAGARVRHVSSARDFRDSRDHENDVDGVHGLGASSAVVGTTDTQSLSNKTLIDATGTLNRIDILSEGGTPWQTTINGDIDHNTNLTVWKRGPAETHEVASIQNNGNLFIRNQNAGADTSTNTYRIRVVKDNGTQDIFSVLSGGSATAWTDAGQVGFQVKPRTADNDAAFRVRNVGDTADTFTVWKNGRVDVNGSDPAFSQMDVHGAAGQSASIMRVMNSDESTTYFSVTGSGNTSLTGNLTANGSVTVGNGLTVSAGSVNLPLESPAGSITAASGFSIVTSNVKIVGDTVHALVVFERTGSNITADTPGGGISDVDAFTLPAAMKPNATYGGQSLPFTVTDGFTGWWGRINSSTGVFEMVAGAPGAVMQSGRNLRVYMTYPAP